ncbi:MULTISPECIES: fibronectin type III-like domain-contianing protein [Aliiglaciecola]|uniref:fibronectin type III-like domain-contianing protein n=1 Tax=Aliiglaciecola TaxID=1406885 RepID=UPI001C097DFF|nr:MULTISPECIES: fibronectin type III-like domain-contianing protein [Aliiglaciecola]MBU2879922.1 fibronectin type III-like domain-contianing protein [Aliiglaciecola lipolytica]MDO6712394.1 fibronectin type III-like domain-contianing protein [Aliiglaciecola sp. 2_MG-2023]MDO6753388.1 fibronectin type III-like domain-contianing protein [Aliiglaciecola sp. 1_MG-2023]
MAFFSPVKYSNLIIDDSKAQANGVIKARVNITNTGQHDGEEVVQFSVHDKFASVTSPVKQLKGFKSVTLKTEESAKLEFSFPVNMLAFYDAQMQLIVEP